MTALRWILVAALSLLGGGWVLLGVVAGGFRRSFGASDVGPLLYVLPLLALGILLAGLIFPTHRILLHAGAVTALGVAAYFAWQLVRESATVTLAGQLVLAAWLVFYWHTAWGAGARRPLTPAGLAYPVLLLDEDKVAEVCLDEAELTLRPENTDHVIEQRFRVVDAAGHQYRIANFRAAGPRPSTLKRVLNASVFNVQRFATAFALVPDGTLTGDQVLARLRDLEWTPPAVRDPGAHGALYRAYRAARYQAFGLSRDRPPAPGRPAGPTP